MGKYRILDKKNLWGGNGNGPPRKYGKNLCESLLTFVAMKHYDIMVMYGSVIYIWLVYL